MALSPVRLTALSTIVAVSSMAPDLLAQDVPDDVRITLERTSCYGTCPIYRVSIDASGNVTYEGTRFVRVEGRQTDRIPVSRVAVLLETADRIDFFALRDQYRSIRYADGTERFVTDLPTAFVTIRRGGRSKRVEDYLGAPDGLRELERQIDEVARTKRWGRIDIPMLQQLAREGWSPSVDERNQLLRNALEHDEVDVVMALLEVGADANAQYAPTYTRPLMMVRSAAAARALMAAGANPLARNDNGKTPLGWATNLAPDVAAVLLQAGVPVDQPADSDGRTALWAAACFGNVGVVRLLVGAGADPTVRAVGILASECARRGREDFRSRRPLPGDNPSFVQDFDGVIALLEQALARRQPQ